MLTYAHVCSRMQELVSMIPVELLAVLPHHKVRLYIPTYIQTDIHTYIQLLAVLPHHKVRFWN